MHRFYLPPQDGPPAGAREWVLAGREAYHATQVLRLRRGNPVVLLDGVGHEYRARLLRADRGSVALEILERIIHPPVPVVTTLVLAVPKGKLFDFVVQKATELGVSRIVPLLSTRVVMRLDDAADGVRKAEHWQTVAIEAVKQCGSAWLPQVLPPQAPKEFLASQPTPDLTLVASLQERSRWLGEAVQDYRKVHGRKPGTVALWIGPEGDFTPEELAMVEAAGAVPVTLGALVLRVDTAALYCLSVLNHEWQARSGSEPGPGTPGPGAPDG